MGDKTPDQSKLPTIDQAYEYFANLAPSTAIGDKKKPSNDSTDKTNS